MKRALALVLVVLAACTHARTHAGTLFVSNLTGKTVSVFDAVSYKPLGTIPLPGTPHAITNDGNGHIWSANVKGDTVTVVDIASRRVLRSIKVCAGPVETAFENGRAFVACGDGNVDVIDTSTSTRTGREVVGYAPHALIAGPHGRLWSANRGSNDISEIDASSGALVARYPAGPYAYGLYFSPDGKYAFVTSKKWNALAVISTSDFQILGSIRVGREPSNVVGTRDGKRLFVSNKGDGTVSVINELTFQVTQTVKVGTQPDGMTLGPDDGLLYVADTGSNAVSVVDAGSGTVMHTFASPGGPSDVEFVSP